MTTRVPRACACKHVHHVIHPELHAHLQLERQNREAQEYPFGPKEYWRKVMVGIWTTGADGHVMTDEDFELDWES